MAVASRTTLKTYFETGDRPTQSQFIDLIDSLVSMNDADASIAGDKTFTGATVALTGATAFNVTPPATFTGDIAVNGGDLTSTATTFNLLNATVTTLNIGGAATTVEIGAATGTTSINNALTVDLTLTITGNTTLTGDLAVNGGDFTSTATTFNLLNATVTTLNIGGAVTAVGIGALNVVITMAAGGSLTCASGNDLNLVAPATRSINFKIGSTTEVTIDNAGSLDPTGAGTQNFGNATNYWADISYKTLSDRGCLGWFDEGVEMPDGSRVTDVKALQAIKKHPSKETVYGVPRLDYASMPKAVYKPADKNGVILPRDAEGRAFWTDNEGNIYYAEDGAELSALVSIILGAVRELADRVAALEKP